MNTVRPNPFPTQPLGQPPARPAQADAGRLAAQRAFFQMAAGQPAAAASPAAATATFQAAAQPAAPVREAPRAQRLPPAGAEAPTRALRPGSLLDIRV